MEGRSSADRRGGRYHVILCVVIGEMTLSTCLLCRLLTQDENQSKSLQSKLQASFSFFVTIISLHTLQLRNEQIARH